VTYLFLGFCSFVARRSRPSGVLHCSPDRRSSLGLGSWSLPLPMYRPTLFLRHSTFISFGTEHPQRAITFASLPSRQGRRSPFILFYFHLPDCHSLMSSHCGDLQRNCALFLFLLVAAVVPEGRKNAEPIKKNIYFNSQSRPRMIQR
jgi:hypothetical protein